MNGKTSPWFKLLALCTAIGLGGAYVWRQQQKAAPHVDKTVGRTVFSGSKSKIILPEEESGILPEPPPEDPLKTDQNLMPGSKSATIGLGSKSDFVLPIPGESKRRTLLPGSKNPARVMEPPEERVLLPGSKSIDAILRPKDVVPPEEISPDKP